MLKIERDWLLNMARDQFGHLEHADLALAVENGFELVVRIDLGPFLFVLQTVLLNVVPKLFR